MSKVLEGLLAQAEAGGVARVTLQAIAEEAAEAGARRALAQLGLTDDKAGHDIIELRQLVQGWRQARKSAVKLVLGWVARTLLTLMLLGAAFKLGLVEGKQP